MQIILPFSTSLTLIKKNFFIRSKLCEKILTFFEHRFACF